MDYDLMMLYLYADSSYLRPRELWRGFLGYSLPILLSAEEAMIEKHLSQSVVYNLVELTAKSGENANKKEVIRFTSMALAKEVGEHQEFGLASFFEGNLPTKFYKTKPSLFFNRKKKNDIQEDNIVAKWLQHLSKIQENPEFIRKTEEWSLWLRLNNNTPKPPGYLKKTA
ncbi:MAG: hypothetical protein K2X39_03795 [Silvanigrellaceae bacterium]|nr:hypothetical protein [Silvanigrellaceae bacterium]